MRFRAPRAVLVSGLALAACLLAGGCSLLPTKERAKPEDALPTGVSEVPAGPRASYVVEVDAPRDLRPLLLGYLDLARFQNAPQAEALSPVELERLCGAAPAQARALLETQGFFNASVVLSRTPAPAGQAERIVVKVDAGDPTRVGHVSYEFSGGLGNAGKEAGAEARAEATDLVAELRRTWALPEGKVFSQAQWAAAKNESLGQARAAGYAAARWDSTAAQVDAQHNRADISLVLDSGPLYHLGALRVDGLLRQEESSVRRLAAFSEGDPYKEKTLLDFQERLQRSGLFDSVTVDIDPDPKLAGATPVYVRVTEAKLQEATVSGGYSANTGPRIAVEHLHRRPFGFNVRAKNKIEWGKENRLYEGELTSHATPSMYRNLLLVKAERLLVNDELRDNYRVRVGRLQETTARDRTYFLELLSSRVVNGGGTTRADALSANYQWTWRNVDSVLLPTKGWAASSQLSVGYSRGDNTDNGPFTRAWGRLNWYRPIGTQWFANVRMEAGQVFVRDSVGMPDGLLFRAGGDDSVRGYAFESLSPKVGNVAHGGRVVWTGSAEVARPIFSDLPQYLGAVFVDAGQAADSWKTLHPVLGYGFGVRWRSPVGPLKVDLAWPEHQSKPRLHFSVGIAF